MLKIARASCCTHNSEFLNKSACAVALVAILIGKPLVSFAHFLKNIAVVDVGVCWMCWLMVEDTTYAPINTLK